MLKVRRVNVVSLGTELVYLSLVLGALRHVNDVWLTAWSSCCLLISLLNESWTFSRRRTPWCLILSWWCGLFVDILPIPSILHIVFQCFYSRFYLCVMLFWFCMHTSLWGLSYRTHIRCLLGGFVLLRFYRSPLTASSTRPRITRSIASGTFFALILWVFHWYFYGDTKQICGIKSCFINAIFDGRGLRFMFARLTRPVCCDWVSLLLGFSICFIDCILQVGSMAREFGWETLRQFLLHRILKCWAQLFPYLSCWFWFYRFWSFFFTSVV